MEGVHQVLVLLLAAFAVLYGCLSVACVLCLRRGLKEVAICDGLRGSVSPDWEPFLRPSASFLQSDSRFVMYLRAFFVAPLGVVVFCSIFLTLGLAGTVLGRSPMFLYPAMGPVLNWLMNVEFQVEGEPQKVPIFVANHSGLLDTHFVGLAFHSITALAKREVASLPFVGRVTRLVGCIFVDRSSASDRQVAQTAIAEFTRTWTETKPTLLIFPEGTTANHTTLLPFKTGAFQPETAFQPIRLEYSNPHFSFSIATNQLVPWTFCFALGGRVKLTFLPVQRRGAKETAEEAAERTRRLVAGQRFALAEAGTYRAHLELTGHVAALRKGQQLPDDHQASKTKKH